MSYNIYDPKTKQLKQIAGNAGDTSSLQPKVLASALTIGGQTVTQVEPALSALNTVKVDKSDTPGLLKNDGTIDTTQYVSDVSNKVDKSSTPGLLKNDGTVDTTQYVSDVSNKVDKSSTPGLLKNDGTVDTTQYVSDVSGLQPKTLATSLVIGGQTVTKVETALSALNTSKVGKSSTAGLLKNDGTVDTTQYVSDVSGLQPKTLATSLNIGGQTVTKVEGALSALNTSKVGKSSTAGLLKNDGTVDTTQYVSDVSNKVDKSSTPGLLKNDGTVDTTQYVSDVSSLQPKNLATSLNIGGQTVTKVEGALSALNTSKVGKSSTAGLLKNDGTVDTTRYVSDVSAYQKKTLSTSLVIGGQTVTKVETALSALNTSKVGTSSTAGLLKNDGTVDTTQYVSDVSALQTKVLASTLSIGGQTVTQVEPALSALNTSKVDKSATAGLLKNDGTVDTTTYISDVSGKTNLTVIAPAFSKSKAYSVGDYVTYSQKLYRFKAAHAAGSWNSSHVISVTDAGQYVNAGKKSSTALGLYATAEGYDVTASGNYSHAEGDTTTASGVDSHAEGSNTVASHDHSHAEGYYTQTGANYQHVLGKYNVGSPSTLFEVGGGIANQRWNVFEVYPTGDIVAGRDVIDSAQNVLRNKQNKTLATTLTIGGQSITTVEGALSALNTQIESLKTYISSYVVENSSRP